MRGGRRLRSAFADHVSARAEAIGDSRPVAKECSGQFFTYVPALHVSPCASPIRGANLSPRAALRAIGTAADDRLLHLPRSTGDEGLRRRCVRHHHGTSDRCRWRERHVAVASLRRRRIAARSNVLNGACSTEGTRCEGITHGDGTCRHRPHARLASKNSKCANGFASKIESGQIAVLTLKVESYSERGSRRSRVHWLVCPLMRPKCTAN